MWYVIQVKALHEIDVAEKCRQRVLVPGEDVFVMMASRMWRRGREWTEQLQPAFQKYIFVETNDLDDFRLRLRRVQEMAKILSVGDDFTPIHPEEEERLKRLGGEEHIIRVSEGYLLGQRLVITDGPLKGEEHTISWVDSRQKLVGIETTLFGQPMTIKLGVNVVRRVIE